VSIRDSAAMTNVLEIGCSSGYYSEVFDIAKLNISYTGVDYSQSFIDLAREYYPQRKFDVQNACCLDFPDESFDLVISGCCLLHIPEYEKAIAESVRVASKFVIFHRTPVVWGENTKYYRKTGYGVEMIEIHFNERALLELLTKHGLRVIKTYILDSSGTEHVGGALKTYLCEK
jgi:ubiquinone/menaquinone biosynthesis C-methylase UbiE